MQQLPKEFLDYLNTIKAKRPKTVIEHILKHGFITSEELKDTYGYNHPTRAVRDVREQGIPIITYRVEGSDGRKIAAYKFGNPSDINISKHKGRIAFTKELKQELNLRRIPSIDNLIPDKAILADTNPHLINFYKAIQNDKITPQKVKTFLYDEGSILLEKGESHYYYIRERLNTEHNPYDFHKNEYIESLWNSFYILTREHFYHVGGIEKNRNPMIEALITNQGRKLYQCQQ